MRNVLSGFVLLLASSTLAYAKTEPPCQLVKLGSFELSFHRNGLLVIPISVNNTPLRFIVDTGSNYTELTYRAAQQIHLKPRDLDRSQHIYTPKGWMVGQYGKADSLGPDSKEGKDLQLLLLPSQELPPDIDGILGSNYLANFDLDFDFANHTLNLMEPNRCKSNVAYWPGLTAEVPFSYSRRYGRIETPIVLDGIKLEASVDTASALTSLMSSVAKTKFDLTEDSSNIELPGAGWPSTSLKLRKNFQTLRFGNLTTNDPLVYVRSDALEESVNNIKRENRGSIFHLDQPAFIVGLNILSKMHVYISYKNEKLYLSTDVSGLTAPAPAQTQASAIAGKVINPPRPDPTHPIPKAKVPPEMADQSEPKKVVLELTVDTEGNIVNASVIQSSGINAVDVAALHEATGGWKFLPGTVDGVPTSMKYKVNVQFSPPKAQTLPQSNAN